jgi:hypothetical protein
MNFYFNNRIYCRWDGGEAPVKLVVADSHEDEGILMCQIDVGVFVSMLCEFNAKGERNGRYGYVHDAIFKGVMLCAGCGCQLDDANMAGTLSVINAACCARCYADKFKPFFDAIKASHPPDLDVPGPTN